MTRKVQQVLRAEIAELDTVGGYKEEVEGREFRTRSGPDYHPVTRPM